MKSFKNYVNESSQAAQKKALKDFIKNNKPVGSRVDSKWRGDKFYAKIIDDSKNKKQIQSIKKALEKELNVAVDLDKVREDTWVLEVFVSNPEKDIPSKLKTMKV